ncbi:MAG: hypothetical protein XD65_1029 [Caldanaerobacter subterraneus]|nr:MAG: hypothetical protein XD65_1029 [Caldanaerobacter subterraneus]
MSLTFNALKEKMFLKYICYRQYIHSHYFNVVIWCYYIIVDTLTRTG